MSYELPDKSSPTDYFKTYDAAIKGLEKNPDDKAQHYNAVISLARAHSYDLAMSEYKRFGLDRVEGHEDIMALEGRLLKDMYLSNTGAVALEYARLSSEKYEKTFQSTKGYYSAVNAATMSLMAEQPRASIEGKARIILELLPKSGQSDKETLYFIEATRAEALLLLGEGDDSEDALRMAVQHDPLNYTAHATTLKQFEMIARKRGEKLPWLQIFAPPNSAHFAGHLFGITSSAMPDLNMLSDGDYEALKLQISDSIQMYDIGFGYGALAAGADILIAESLLSEGAECHIILPTEPEVFVEKSVAPYGSAWVDRYWACLSSATSLRVLTRADSWPNAILDTYANRIAMGQAVMKSKILSTGVTQILIWDGEPASVGTGHAVETWRGFLRNQILINYTGQRTRRHENFLHAKPEDERMINIDILMCERRASKPQVFTTVSDAAHAALAQQRHNNNSAQIGLHVGPNIAGNTLSSLTEKLADAAVLGSVLVSEDFAALLALETDTAFNCQYMGRVELGENEWVRAFSLSGVDIDVS